MQRTLLLFISYLPLIACSGYNGHEDSLPDASTTYPEPGVCGNGLIDLAGVEECDDGNVIGGDGCSADCTLEVDCVPGAACGAACGDGILQAAEACDDGNTVSGDGCSPDCTLEAGDCIPGLPCDTRCGDGVIEPGELCDDGNVTDGDGCSANCSSLESGFGCPVPGQPCVPPTPAG